MRGAQEAHSSHGFWAFKGVGALIGMLYGKGG